MERSKLFGLSVFGLAFWLTGALTVKIAGPYVFAEGSPAKPVMFALIVPATWALLALVRRALALRDAEMLTATAVMTSAATLADGLALTWFRGLYANSYEVSHYGAAWILWGGGVGFALGWRMTGRRLVGGATLWRLAVLGFVFWLIAALIVRFGGAGVFSEANPLHVLLLALTVPLARFFIFVTEKLAALEKSATLAAVSLVTAVAMLLDGVALIWFRGLYANSYEVSHYGAAFILFGVGVGLLLAARATFRSGPEKSL